ncbi:caspase domain-containing protein [Streptomyces sp. NPDC020983]|uniref:caspase domain-containing protein n=1 Tax=Streptomyces sp. NPDC020983 TaxID=3365106 RepID=UPI0037B5233D
MSERPDPTASRAVLVGVSHYSFLEPLPAVANNLPALASALTAADAWGLPEDHCTIISEPRDAQKIADVLWQQAQAATDTLLFYFGGHGLIDSRGELLLGLADSRHGRSHTGIPYQWLREAMVEGGRPQRYVIILDCCFSGRALGLMSTTNDLVDTAQIDGSYLLAAAGENALAIAPPGETYTAFTGELLDCLTSGVPGGPPELDLDTVYRHLREQLAAKALPVPHKRDRNTAGALVLARNPAYRAQAERPLAPAPVTASLWPTPASFTTCQDFLNALGQVRAVAGLPVQRVAERAKVSASTVSALINRTTLPTRWTTTGAYLLACGLTSEQEAEWKAVWQQLRASAPAAPAVASSQPTAVETATDAIRPRWWRRSQTSRR